VEEYSRLIHRQQKIEVELGGEGRGGRHAWGSFLQLEAF
jgi:hypothetical protein